MPPASTSRRRMTREEALRRQEQKQRIEEKRRESYELSHGPIDLPFCFLVLLLTAVGLVMLLSASFPSAYYETGNATHYFIRQAASVQTLAICCRQFSEGLRMGFG